MLSEEFDSLLRACRANAEWAWQQLYLEFAPPVLRYLRSQGAPDADDLLGDTFVQVVTHLSTFSGGPDDFRGWVFRIAQNRLVDARRRAGARPAATELTEERADVDTEPSAADVVHLREDELRTYRMLRVLPEDQRAVVFMRYGLDMQPAEIAAVLDRPVSAVKMLQQRGVRTLRSRLVGGAELSLHDAP